MSNALPKPDRSRPTRAAIPLLFLIGRVPFFSGLLGLDPALRLSHAAVCAATELSVRCSQDLFDLRTTSVLRPDRRGEPVVTASPFSPSLAFPHNNSADAALSTGVYTAAMTDPLSPEVEPLIPRLDKAQAADNRLDQVREFLLSERRPAKLDDGGFEALVRFATRFFL